MHTDTTRVPATYSIVPRSPPLYILLFLFRHCVYFKRSVCSSTTQKHSLLICLHVTDVFFTVSTCTLSNMYVVSLRYVSRYIWNFRKSCIKRHTGNSSKKIYDSSVFLHTQLGTFFQYNDQSIGLCTHIMNRLVS